MRPVMNIMSDDPRVVTLVETIWRARQVEFEIRVATWGISQHEAADVARRKYIEVLDVHPSRVVRWYRTGQPLPSDGLLKECIREFAEQAYVRDIPAAFKVLAELEDREGDRFRGFAGRKLRNPVLAEQVVCHAFDEVREYRLSSELESAAVALSSTAGETDDSLRRALRAYVWDVTRKRVIDAARKTSTEAREGRSHRRSDVVDIETVVVLAEIDRFVERSEQVSAIERSYWKWKRKNPDTPDCEFPDSPSSVATHRIKRSLAHKIVAWCARRQEPETGVGGIR